MEPTDWQWRRELKGTPDQLSMASPGGSWDALAVAHTMILSSLSLRCACTKERERATELQSAASGLTRFVRPFAIRERNLQPFLKPSMTFIPRPKSPVPEPFPPRVPTISYFVSLYDIRSLNVLIEICPLTCANRGTIPPIGPW
jgi:hypothetical protein